jgi:hypothetical protein
VLSSSSFSISEIQRAQSFSMGVSGSMFQLVIRCSDRGPERYFSVSLGGAVFGIRWRMRSRILCSATVESFIERTAR